jgi:hypothetical protein
MPRVGANESRGDFGQRFSKSLVARKYISPDDSKGAAMQIVGDRHYMGAAGEHISFSVGQTHLVALITCSPGGSLPVGINAGAHRHLVVTVSFTANDGGLAEVLVNGSFGGSDTSRIRQLTSLPFRTAIFIVD